MVFNHFSITQLSFNKYSTVQVKCFTDHSEYQCDSVVTLNLFMRLKTLAVTHKIPMNKASCNKNRQIFPFWMCNDTIYLLKLCITFQVVQYMLNFMTLLEYRGRSALPTVAERRGTSVRNWYRNSMTPCTGEGKIPNGRWGSMTYRMGRDK